eukprot:TRINITY_DN728_c0_g1_i2.p2 TRINITY_DN728_c0_g1~~TRINITY_DN728_c0_g1_i2.p2  ORF type:complete len:101 (+),score=12.96 TRINITY_DN728_c0_g1_i2:231-533(+)
MKSPKVVTPSSNGNRSWADVVSKNRDIEVGIRLDFVLQQFSSIEVFIDKDEWKQGISRWENSLLDFIYCMKPHILKMQNFVRNRWEGDDIVLASQIERDF